ncbi:hypothetical protein [Actinocrispum sp. NPDC049592]|uniref:DUF6892 domain-containing protein n=1 Tax=Actinocrispum sp. NPDC049592 TaxID=3154835 RepID=UPI003433D3C9
MSTPLHQLEDDNLRLAVLDRLMATEVLPRFDRKAFNGDDYDEDLDYEYRDDVADALLAIPVTAEQCSSIREVHWEAGYNDVIFDIWAQWDGESDEFTVTSLAGIAAALPSLESLSIQMCAVNDLSPLKDLTQLRTLALNGGFAVTDLSPLACLGALRSLTLNHVLDPRALTGILQPLAGSRLETIDLDTNGNGTGVEPLFDFAPLEHMTSLRTLRFRRSVRSGPAPVATAFDNARVLAVLRDRDVRVDIA